MKTRFQVVEPDIDDVVATPNLDELYGFPDAQPLDTPLPDAEDEPTLRIGNPTAIPSLNSSVIKFDPKDNAYFSRMSMKWRAQKGEQVRRAPRKKSFLRKTKAKAKGRKKKWVPRKQYLAAKRKRGAK